MGRALGVAGAHVVCVTRWTTGSALGVGSSHPIGWEGGIGRHAARPLGSEGYAGWPGYTWPRACLLGGCARRVRAVLDEGRCRRLGVTVSFPTIFGCGETLFGGLGVFALRCHSDFVQLEVL